MRLAIADPPYPPMFGERYDTVTGIPRLTKRSRATRWYGDGPRSATDSPVADFHPEASKWDDLKAHRDLMELLLDNYDGWVIATTPDGLGAYGPLPVAARVMSWVRMNAIPGGNRLMSRWEPVIAFIPEARRIRSSGPRVSDVLIEGSPRAGFVGAKPYEWTDWVLDAMGYSPGADTVDDVFPGSGRVTVAIERRLENAC